MRHLLTLIAAACAIPAIAAEPWDAKEADAHFRDVQFASGERLADLRIHYTTLGTPRRDAQGRIDNAILLLHGTGGSGQQFFRRQFADSLFGPGQPLDIRRYYIILPDNIGHGASSKPSDGLRMAFPRYDYADMVAAQHRLVTETLGIQSLQLILGTSMGCMHAFVWGIHYPGTAKRLAPFACNAVEIAGRNRTWRKLAVDAIKADPAWQDGAYTRQPLSGLRTAASLSLIASINPVAAQVDYPTREASERWVDSTLSTRAGADANDIIYQYESSRTYNPAPLLERITVPVLWINSADDFINPPELGLAQKSAKRMPKARFILLPATPETKGHGTHTWAKFWAADLARLLAKSVR